VAVGLIPIWTSLSGGLPGLSLATGNRIIFSMPAAQASDFATVQVTRSTTNTGGTTANIVRALGVQTTVGANDGASNYNLIATTTSNSTVGGHAGGGYFQAFRTASSNAAVVGAIMGAYDQGDQASSVDNSPVLGVEIDVGANLADDASNSAMWGGQGVRNAVHIVGIRQTGTDTGQTQITNGLWFTTSTSSPTAYDQYTNWGSLIALAVNTQTYNGLDTRAAVPPTGSPNPVISVNMLAGQALDFNGGPALNSAPGSYLQYTTSGGNRLRYTVGSTERFSISDVGSVTLAGVSFGSTYAANATDLSKHIALYGTNYGLNVISGYLNVDVPSGSSIAMNVGGSAMLAVTGSNIVAGEPVLPVLDNVYPLGGSSNRWSNVYAAAGAFSGGVTISAGGVNVTGGATIAGGETITGGLTVSTGATTLNGLLATHLPAAVTATSYTIAGSDVSLVLAPTGTMTLSMPTASGSSGRLLFLKLTTAFAVNSAVSNVTPLAGGTASSAIMPATAGKYCMLQSDGTTWQIMQAN
jgi:hypothetical protein